MLNDFPTRIVARAKRDWARYSFDRTARAVLTTGPLELRGDSPLFLSQLRHADVIAYLLAIKSVYPQFGHGQIRVISDGSLDAGDVKILEHHLPGIGFLDVSSIATAPCPRGGTWERLVKIVELSAENYVVQVDADILAIAPAPELARCWQENKSFLLGTGAGQGLAPARETACMVQGWIEQYKWNPIPVGIEAEAALDRLPNAGARLYVHASSGFGGYARGAFKMSELHWFSTTMAAILGAERWAQLGTEQIGSNYILANAPGAFVLPFPRYTNFEPPGDISDSALVHFIGKYRYERGAYRRHAASFISRCVY